MPSPARLFLHQGAPFAAPPAHGIRRAVRMPCMRKGFWPLESRHPLSKGQKLPAERGLLSAERAASPARTGAGLGRLLCCGAGQNFAAFRIIPIHEA